MFRTGLSIIVGISILCTATTAHCQTTNIQPLKKTRDRAARAMSSLLYGPAEMPNRICSQVDEDAQTASCDARTRTELEKDIARIIDGAWGLATFWRPAPCIKPGCTACPSCVKKEH